MNDDLMPALTFQMKIGKLAKSFIRGKFNETGYWKKGGPISIQQVPLPKLMNEDWVRIKTTMCGICGSDLKEITLSGARDNPIQSLITFPQIMGHEPVGIIESIGSNVTNLKIGDRVAISPWFPCKPRGISPECPRCQIGDYTHCHNFNKGILPSGMHLGVVTGFGGFAPYIAVHQSQCFKIPENVSFEEAVLADPFSVAFHACLTLNPRPDSKILVYGLGIIGFCIIICLKHLFHVKHVYAVGRYPFQKELALKLGVEHVFTSAGKKLIEEIAQFHNIEFYYPDNGLPWAIDGFDGIIDNIASASTLEIGMRILISQGKLVFPGVNTPARMESTVHYFKELEVIGSNAFAIEKFNGAKKHAFEFFMDFLKDGTINLKGLVTHQFRLEDYSEAFKVLTSKNNSNAVKVVFKFN